MKAIKDFQKYSESEKYKILIGDSKPFKSNKITLCILILLFLLVLIVLKFKACSLNPSF